MILTGGNLDSGSRAARPAGIGRQALRDVVHHSGPAFSWPAVIRRGQLCRSLSMTSCAQTESHYYSWLAKKATEAGGAARRSALRTGAGRPDG
jgi:hypothetical protein